MNRFYIKNLICVILIICMITPTMASLSASDGSAFVTKGEFDSAMSDFNSRLTTFEAGINSKIDSQVTSYLDRNGIWSGKDAELARTDLELFGIQESDDARYSYYNYPNSGTVNRYIIGTAAGYYLMNTDTTVLNVDGRFDDNANPNKILLIDKINKNGLMCFKFDRSYGPKKTADKTKSDWGTVQTAVARPASKATYYVTGDQFGLYYLTMFSIYTLGRDINNTLLPDSDAKLMFQDTILKSVPAPARFTAIHVQNNFAYFFVKKNEQLFAKTDCSQIYAKQVGTYNGMPYIATYYSGFKATIY